MAQGKQTPRQKMINLMYLVFIAMMALNIDQEIIRSYYDSTQSLLATRLLTEDKNNNIFEKTLQIKAANAPDTYGQPYQQYLVLKQKIDVLVAHADQVKDKLKKDSEFNPDPKIDMNENFSALNNNQATTEYFFKNGDENIPSQKALELKAKIDDVRNYIDQTFKGNPDMAKLVDRADKSLITEFPPKVGGKKWLQYKFYHQPLIAAVSNLEILENDARNVQSDALALMLQEKVDASIKFNQYDAVVSAPTDVIAGTDAQATVYLASYSNSNKINISGVDRQENGKGFKALSTAGVGPKTFSGVITLNEANGKSTPFPFTHTYNVIAGPQEVKLQSGALLSADKMNVLYRGLDNPISGSILGADNTQINLSAPGAAVSGGKGKWIVKPGAGSTITLTISGKDPHGKLISQPFTFRIKNVPPPQGQIRGKNAMGMPATSLVNQIVSAAIPDFDFPVTFTVTSFKVKVPGRATMLVQGNSMSGAAGLFKNLRAGDAVNVFDINTTVNGLNQIVPPASPVAIDVQ